MAISSGIAYNRIPKEVLWVVLMVYSDIYDEARTCKIVIEKTELELNNGIKLEINV